MYCKYLHFSEDMATVITIVSRGEWLGSPANFKGGNNRHSSEVEQGRHVITRVHTLDHNNKHGGRFREFVLDWR